MACHESANIIYYPSQHPVQQRYTLPLPPHINNIAQNQQGILLQPDLNIVATALTNLQTQLPRIANIGPIQQAHQLQPVLNLTRRVLARSQVLDRRSQQILRQNRRIRTHIRQFRNTGRQALQRLSTLEFRAQNAEIRARNTTARVQPLLNIQIEAPIQICPRTAGGITSLTRARADQILQALGIAVGATASLAQRREAVRLALLR